MRLGVLVEAVFFSIVLLFFQSCALRHCTNQVVSLSNRKIPLFIEMPENKLVFENLSPIVYDSLWNHFDRVGFTLVDSPRDCYVLKVAIKDVDSPYKFLSPDLLSYAVKMKIELLCQLFNKDQTMCVQKVFSFTTLISKAEDHVVNSSFIDFEYRRLLEREIHKIDHYFRPFLLKDVTNKDASWSTA